MVCVTRPMICSHPGAPGPRASGPIGGPGRDCLSHGSAGYWWLAPFLDCGTLLESTRRSLLERLH
jgi:hypothetical protein